MDRHLEIALTSAALAIAWAYIFRRRLRTRPGPDQQSGFWALMIVLGLCEAIFVGMAVTNFAAWLMPA